MPERSRNHFIMARRLFWERIKKHKGISIVYLVTVIVLIKVSIMPLGYSVKNNKDVDINFTETRIFNDRCIASRTYSESYAISVAENIRFNGLKLSYRASDINFKGILVAKIMDGNETIGSSSIKLMSTGESENFSVIKLDFGVNTHLLKNKKYTLILNIDTNMPDYYIREYNILDQKNDFCEFVTDKSLLTAVSYTPISMMQYYEVFYGFVILFIVVITFLLLQKIDISFMNIAYIKKISCYIQNHYNEFMLLLMFVYMALFEFYYAYVQEVYISPDSTGYLMAADAILNGYGFNIAGRAGYVSWYAAYPIGYPLLIAGISFITGRNLYLSSKILAVLIVGVFLILLYVKFKEKAWIYSFCLLNMGFLNIYKYTWSEIPFILGLLVFCLILDHIIQNDIVKIRWFAFWGLSSAYVFLCRYFGTFTFIIIGITWLGYLGMYIFKQGYKNSIIRAKIIGCTVSGLISGTVIGSYYLMNYIRVGSISGVDRGKWWDEYTALTVSFYNALIAELTNAFRIILPEPIVAISRYFKIWIIVLFLIVILYLFYKYKPKDFRTVFIGVGIFYYFMFVIIRYHSSMDTFGFRFFVPASILITIGIIGFIASAVQKNKNQIAPIVICIMALAIGGLTANLRYFDRHNTAYSRLCAEYSLKDIPLYSTILGAEMFESEEGVDQRTRALRTDINFTNNVIGVNDTMDTLFERYGKSDYICVKAKHIKEILFYPIYEYDKSVIDYFKGEVKEDTPNEEYIIISVKDQIIQ